MHFSCYFVLFFCKRIKVTLPHLVVSKISTHSSPRTDLMWREASLVPHPQPCLFNVCRMWFCVVLLKNAWLTLGNMLSWRQHMLLWNLGVLSSINATTLEVSVTFDEDADTNPHQKAKTALDRLQSITAPHIDRKPCTTTTTVILVLVHWFYAL